MLKTELHAHTADDPVDLIPHSSIDLIERAAALGYQVLAITLHDRYLDIEPLLPHARRCGITLIAGIEKTIEGRHVLLINFDAAAERVGTFDELRRLRQARPTGLVVAPHPFYPSTSCVGRILEQQPDLFDAVEFSAIYTFGVGAFNRTAIRWARRHGKPLVANGDVHRLVQLGRTYSLVDAEPEPDAICAAIRGGRVAIEAEPLSTWQAARLAGNLATDHLKRLVSGADRTSGAEPVR